MVMEAMVLGLALAPTLVILVAAEVVGALAEDNTKKGPVHGGGPFFVDIYLLVLL
jgi:hypothetical protein